MGISKAAAILAAVVACVLFAAAVALRPPADSGPATRGPGGFGVQAGPDLRGQAWATELFGRRYGRNLLAAATADAKDSRRRG